MGLIDALKKEHIELNNLLRDVQSAGVTTQNGQKKLKDSKVMLLKHLQKEDDQLYPELKKLEATKVIASSFEEDMKAITKLAMEFFKKYESFDGDPMDFAKDFGRFVGAFKQRIIKEEVNLYPKYEKLVG